MLRLGKLEISGGFLLMAALMIYFDGQNLLLWGALACAIHEAGHYAAIKLFGGHALKLRLTAVGGEMLLSARKTLSYGQELIAVLAGPAANLAAAYLAAILAREEAQRAFLFAGVNLVIGLFNLLPAYPLDGGHAIKILVSILWSQETAEDVVYILSLATALLMLAAGCVILWHTRYNFTLLLVAVWLLVTILWVGIGKREFV